MLGFDCHWTQFCLIPVTIELEKYPLRTFHRDSRRWFSQNGPRWCCHWAPRQCWRGWGSWLCRKAFGRPMPGAPAAPATTTASSRVPRQINSAENQTAPSITGAGALLQLHPRCCSPFFRLVIGQHVDFAAENPITTFLAFQSYTAINFQRNVQGISLK